MRIYAAPARPREIKRIDENLAISYCLTASMSLLQCTKSRIFLLTSLLAGTVALGCGEDHGHEGGDDPTCEEDTRDDEFVAGISKTGGAGYTLSIVDSLPAPPDKGNNVWTIALTDSNGDPLSGVALEAEPFMPDHGHGTPEIAVFTDNGDGNFTLDPVNFFMPGYWETTVTVVDEGATDAEDDDVDLDTVVFKFCVDG